MTKTPEQTLRGLLALGEKATGEKWDVHATHLVRVLVDSDTACPIFESRTPDPKLFEGRSFDERFAKAWRDQHVNACFIAASKNALPAIRSLLEDVKVLRGVAKAAQGLINNFDDLDRMSNIDETERLEAALSRLGGK